MDKKPDWLKRNVIKSAKFQTAPISLSIDQEINHHIEECGLTVTQLFREFICDKTGKKISDIERLLANYIKSMAKLDSKFLSKDFRIFCMEKIKKIAKKSEVRERMEKKEGEE